MPVRTFKARSGWNGARTVRVMPASVWANEPGPAQPNDPSTPRVGGGYAQKRSSRNALVPTQASAPQPRPLRQTPITAHTSCAWFVPGCDVSEESDAILVGPHRGVVADRFSASVVRAGWGVRGRPAYGCGTLGRPRTGCRDRSWIPASGPLAEVSRCSPVTVPRGCQESPGNGVGRPRV
jgi:hypothetical protein